MELASQMLGILHVDTHDQVVEFAPGIGAAAQLTQSRVPAQYPTIESDEASVRFVSG